MGEAIGTVQAVSGFGGYIARCKDCRWTLTQRAESDAEKSLRSHAALTHPPLRTIYRAEATS